MADERSWGSAILAVAAIGLLGASLGLTWFEYDYSSGRQTAPGGPQDPADQRVEHRHIEYRPNSETGVSDTDGTPTGTAKSSDPALSAQTVQRMAWAVFAAMGILFLMALGEFPGIHRVIRRRVGLALGTLALACIVAVVALAWFQLPASLAGYGVTGPFFYALQGDGYTRTSLDWGWAAAALAVPTTLGAILFKFQAGSAQAAMAEVLGVSSD